MNKNDNDSGFMGIKPKKGESAADYALRATATFYGIVLLACVLGGLLGALIGYFTK